MVSDDNDIDSLNTFRNAIDIICKEHKKYETEKNLWLVEREQLQNKILLLENNFKSQEKVKLELAKRVKILEHSLKQERLRTTPENKIVYSNAPSEHISPTVHFQANVESESNDTIVVMAPNSPQVVEEGASNHERKASVTSTSRIPSKSSEPFVASDKDLNTSNISNLFLSNSQLQTNSDSGDDSISWSLLSSYRSHVDGVRTVNFHPKLPLLISGSEDGTAKIWNCQPAIAALKGGHVDDSKAFEPIATLRGHRGAVLTSAFNADSGLTFTGGIDGKIGVWKTPSPKCEAYAPQGKVSSHRICWFTKHTDAVWGLEPYPNQSLLLSIGADGFLNTWNFNQAENPCISSISYTSDDNKIQSPTTLTITPDGKIFVGYSSGELVEFDSETRQTLRVANSESRITALVSHPSSSLILSGHLDASVKFFDVRCNKWFHSMKAHSETISSLAIDNSGQYLLSSSHDSSVRTWNLANQRCINDLSEHQTHRKKFDEGVHSIALHPHLSLCATGGADAVIKLFSS